LYKSFSVEMHSLFCLNLLTMSYTNVSGAETRLRLLKKS